MPTEAPWGQQAKTYHAQEDRRMVARVGLPGIVSGILPAPGTPGLKVDITAGEAIVPGSHAGVTRQGHYPVYWPGGSVTLTAAHATLPRIDQVVLRIKDTEPAPGVVGDASSDGDMEVVTGTATAGATLANRTGAATMPPSSLRILDVLVPAAFGGPFVLGTHLRDRRAHSGGASFYQNYNGANLGLSTTAAAIYGPRMEISHPAFNGTDKGIVWHVLTGVFNYGGGGAWMRGAPWVDAAPGSLDGTTAWANGQLLAWGPSGAGFVNFHWKAFTVVPLGSHLIGWGVSADAGLTTPNLQGGFPLVGHFWEETGVPGHNNGHWNNGA